MSTGRSIAPDPISRSFTKPRLPSTMMKANDLTVMLVQNGTSTRDINKAARRVGRAFRVYASG